MTNKTVFTNKLDGMKEQMITEKGVQNVTYYEKKFCSQSYTLADRLDTMVRTLAKELANAKWERMAADTNAEYNEWDKEWNSLYKTATLLDLNREVKPAMDEYYEELVELWGNPTNK
jgi:hypothetical protein